MDDGNFRTCGHDIPASPFGIEYGFTGEIRIMIMGAGFNFKQIENAFNKVEEKFWKNLRKI
jgi:hypothetical protein